MGRLMEGRKEALETWLAARMGADRVSLTEVRKLSGGAIQENWAVDAEVTGGPFAGVQALVVRTDAPSGVAVSHGRAQEFALFKAAFDAGVTVPEPLWLEAEGAVLGKPFFAMRRIAGVAAGHKVVKDDALGGGREVLVAALGRELARIHTVRPPRDDLGFLAMPEGSPALAWVAEFRGWLDGHRRAHPVLEWGLRWLERHAPQRGDIVLSHNDFRTGNLMVDRGGVTGVLDWEFASWGDPLADVGWFCAPCWRFGQRQNEAGGIGPREAFYRGYESESGRPLDRTQVFYWEVMATMRWAIIALQQAERHVCGGETNLELALTAHVVPELEMDILDMTREDG
ncbi:phosphotransferase family protein [Caenispirillum bisanense]|uniref:Predicted kinase, aminoglycoside phosphotransferase (APT) family n=1 Tax=Caenispirillum bisanense TaxID=414052 RepID=A0A286GY09_9PROT|nr:phosphotransferase family protein [Caenispirillum bisanense]SOE00425.1 Predicted kinase, aminoglycoside phosphotransferase (APT) family [Caenispirillum bisanense]